MNLGSDQIVRFGKALKAYAIGEEPPEGCYPGEHTRAVALALAESVPVSLPDEIWGKFGGTRVLARQREDLKAFGVEMDTWKRESDLHLRPGIGAMFRHLHVTGTLVMVGNGGRTICGECGGWLEEWSECKFCTGQEPLDPVLVAWRVRHLRDLGLHPDNDFMPEGGE